MKLKITGRTVERFRENLEAFLNMATLICLQGHIPSDHDIESAESMGRWWTFEEQNNRYQILGITNDNWLHVRERGEDFMVVEFKFRYDNDNVKRDSITMVMLAFLRFVEPVGDIEEKMKIIKRDQYRDGGTKLYVTNKGEFCVDNRIASTTIGQLYQGYPKDDKSNKVTDPEVQKQFEQALVEFEK